MRLRIGAKVLCTTKIHEKIRTGSIGVVHGFVDPDEYMSAEPRDPFEFGYNVDPVQAAHDRDCVQPQHIWPEVMFQGTDGKSLLLVVRPRQVDVEDNTGHVLCSRTQIPLILAYALTVHRAQGLTLGSVVMDVSNLFAHGQLYTGLSRVANFANLRVYGPLDQEMKCCHRVVRDFELNTVWTYIANGPDDPDGL